MSFHRADFVPYPFIVKARPKLKCALVFEKGEQEKLHRKYKSAQKFACSSGVKDETSWVRKFFHAICDLIRR